MESVTYVLRPRGTRDPRGLENVTRQAAQEALRFHQTIPGYEPTPLYRLPGLAKALGVGEIYLKDESSRFGLNAFKVLGGSYAMAKCLAKRLGEPLSALSFEQLGAQPARRALGQLTFVTATDGNHGRGVAWAARILGHRAVVYLPKGSAQERLQRILDEGAQAEITTYCYDDTVRYAAHMAQEHGWILLQDTSWEGYEEMPRAMMQGYATLAQELVWQLEQMEEQRPTHLFLQAGVGSFAGAVLGYLTQLWGEQRPVAAIVEPNVADCCYQTAKANDGTIHTVPAERDSIMAGLCCGEPCPLSWPILDSCADAFLSCPDRCAEEGVRLLERPMGEDPRVEPGASGAVGAGILEEIMTHEELEELRSGLGLDENSRVLLINTEGSEGQPHVREGMEA